MKRAHPAAVWNRFWFAEQPTSTLALLRIAIGSVALAWSLALIPNVGAFFADDGIEPTPVDVTWGVLGHLRGDVAMYALYAVLVASALCVVVGFRTRLASVALFVCVFAFIERTPSIYNSGDALLRNLTCFLMFMPAGESFSIDRWRLSRDERWEFAERPIWGLRLVQLQVSLLYLSSVHHKLDSGGWTDGSALSYVWRMDDIVRFRVPEFVSESVGLSTWVSYLTIAIELMLGVLIWVRSARPLVLGLGVALHVGIGLSVRVGFFSAAIIAAYVAFLDPTTASNVMLRARRETRSRYAGS